MMPAPLPDAPPQGKQPLGQRRFARLGRGGAAIVLALAASAAANYALAKRAERRNPPQGTFVTADGVRLHYLDRRGDAASRRSCCCTGSGR